MQSKKDLSERDICTKYITPALEAAGWDINTQVREEVTFTDGRIYVKGNRTKRGKGKRADYILYYKEGTPVAIIEAKDNKHTVRAGMQQALNYAEILDIPCVYSSNGDAFYEFDRSESKDKIEEEIPLDAFPSPEELWKRYKKFKGIESPEEERIATQDYFYDPGGKKPRYYQVNAINRTVEAVAKGQNRILLVMATGTGKTLTAFQIAYRLWKSGTSKRILFLADRNVLIDQTKRGDFKYFGDKMTKIKKKQIDKSYEVYLALYQGLTNYDEDADAYREFSPDFFDLIIIDECHRGSAAADSAWREILSYFNSATHIGLTATPKETADVSNIDYFGNPIYTYSLKQGIDDGFLAPYKVIKITLDRDAEGWRPEKGKLDEAGAPVEDRIYNKKDFDKSLVIKERTELVARKVTEFLHATNPFDKTIIFCVDIDHAERMREAIANENSDLYAQNTKYVMKITGDDELGKNELDNFINPEEKYPVIATTSKLMTTGVDAQTCKLIVLDSNIASMTEFKQIIGRGTRINEEFDKLFFTIMDFRNVTSLFADPDFDGDPVVVYKPDPDGPVAPEEPNEEPVIDEENDEEIIFDEPESDGGGEIEEGHTKKVYVNDVEVMVVNERVQYYDHGSGKLITEKLTDYTRTTVQKQYQSLDEFLTRWTHAAKKTAVIEELEEQGIFFENLQEEVGKNLDPFDLICHIVFEQPPLTRKERAENVKKRNYFAKYGEQAVNVLNALLDKYADDGIENIESNKILSLQPISDFGTPAEIVGYFGGVDQFKEAVRELEDKLYKAA